jgi:PAS domain S-box-containing protein
MLLNRQRTLLTIVASLAFAGALLVTALAAREVRLKTAQISMAEETIRAVTNFRYLTMEVVLYREPRAARQWADRFDTVKATLAAHQYSGREASLLLERERANLAVLDRLFSRLNATTEDTVNASPGRSSTIVSALFLTTQDMLDDGFDLMRLIRLDLEAAQRRATVGTIASLALLMLLIAFASLVMKHRVLEPVAALQRLTEQVTMGQLDVRLNLLEPNEIGLLGRTFDTMTMQLQQSHQAMQRKSDELARAQEALQAFIDHTPALVTYWDSELHNRFANQAYEEWFGQTPQQVRGRHIADVVGAALFAELEPRLRLVLAGRSELFERRFTLPGGKVRDALFSYIPDLQDGQVRGMYGFVSDISSLRHAEAGQQAALLQLQSVLNAAGDFAIIKTDLAGTIKLFSAGAERMLGYSAAEVVGLQGPGLFHLPGGDAPQWVAQEGASETAEWTFVRKDGSTVPVTLTLSEVRNAQGAIAGYLGVARDIRAERESRRVLADARDQAQQASLAKSQFLANMSHEIRTPMNAVLGMLELLQHTALSPLQADYARKSESAARALLELLNDILDFSQVEANKLELERSPFRLDGLLRDLSVILSSLLGNKDVELVFAIDPALPPMLVGDATRLRQVLINLASNAIKFTEHGEITVELRLQHGGAEHCTVQFAVHDTGIGIPAAKQASIFDGFTQAEASTTRRFGGTGLGLTISQRLVGLMGGRLEVDSTVGRGSRFAFAVAFGLPAGGAGEADALAPRKVLVVDDSGAARASLLAMLEALGCECTAAPDAEHALALLVSGAGPAFDAVLLDWRMPGIDGWDLARQLRMHAAPMQIFLMATAHGRSALADNLQRDPARLSGFLAKPVTPSALREALAGPAPGSAAAPAAPLQRLAGLHLMVVDDNVMNQQIARELLVREGAAVDVAGGGARALHMAAGAAYDAILMDIQMPDMDGYECTRALRATPAHRSTPVIAMTANVLASDREACLAAGMDDHVGKPIAIDSMVAVLLRLCRPGHDVAPVPAPAPAAAAAAVPASAGAAAIDLGAALARMGGDRALYMALARTYATEAQQFMPSLKEALAQPDAKVAADILHTFKSAAGIVGAGALQAAAVSLEARLRSGAAFPDPDAALAQLQALVDDSMAALDQVTAALAHTPAGGAAAGPLDGLLLQLQAQLAARDMAALATMARISQGYGAALADRMAPLAQAVGALDFARAEQACSALRDKENDLAAS